MPAGRWDFEIEQGATFSRKLTWKKKSTNEIINLTGYTARMQVRKSVTDPLVLLEMSTENGKITIDPDYGVINLFLTPQETSQIKFKGGFYDLELRSPSGYVFRLLQGKVIVSFEVTR